MFDDQLVPIRRRFPTGPPWPVPSRPTIAVVQELLVPFAARYGVPAPVLTARHSRPPTRMKVSQPAQVTGDGNAQPPRPDDTLVDAVD